MKSVFFSAALLISGASVAAVPINGWYSSVFGGIAYIPNDLDVITVGHYRSGASYQPGYNAGGRIGFQSYPLRYEAEFTYVSADLKKFSIDSIRQRYVTGKTTAAAGMANVYYDFPDMVPAISPFLGVGIGYAMVDGTFNSRNAFRSTHYKASESAFAYQGTAGITYNFSESYAINIAYRYLATDKIHDLGKVFQANLGTVGVVYRFDEATYK